MAAMVAGTDGAPKASLRVFVGSSKGSAVSGTSACSGSSPGETSYGARLNNAAAEIPADCADDSGLAMVGFRSKPTAGGRTAAHGTSGPSASRLSLERSETGKAGLEAMEDIERTDFPAAVLARAS